MNKGNSMEPVGWTKIRKINSIWKDLKTMIFKNTYPHDAIYSWVFKNMPS